MYATRADMILAYGEDELIQLTDRGDPATDEIDDAILAAALAEAGAEIDGYVGRVVDLPLDAVPAILRRLAVVITRYRLSTDISDGRVRLDYEDALDTLTKISKGTIVLDLPADLSPSPILNRVQGWSPTSVLAGVRGRWP